MRNLSDDVLKKKDIAPAALTSTQNGSWVDTRGYERVLYLVEVGTVSGTSPTMDFKVQQATDSSGTSAKDLSSASLTQVTSSNYRAEIEFSTNKLDEANGFYFVRGVATIGGTSPSFAMTSQVLLSRARDLPVTHGLDEQVQLLS